LSVPLVGTGTSDLQHVAFGCRDVFAAARAMRHRGAPLLAVSDNYYDDLAARTELPAELIERMRAHAVLYDAEPGGAELLHFYTALVGTSLFFEVVERRGGYDGYGAANSPARLAAQARWSFATSSTALTMPS
jgi:4-hydroxyphenylpyruvate dioxygenase